MIEAGLITDCASGVTGSCTAVLAEGNTLNVRSSVAVTLGGCVKVEDSNRMWMGEVWSCEPDGDAFSITVEATTVIGDVAGLDLMARQFRHERAVKHDPDSSTGGPTGGRRNISGKLA